MAYVGMFGVWWRVEVTLPLGSTNHGFRIRFVASTAPSHEEGRGLEPQALNLRIRLATGLRHPTRTLPD